MIYARDAPGHDWRPFTILLSCIHLFSVFFVVWLGWAGLGGLSWAGLGWLAGWGHPVDVIKKFSEDWFVCSLTSPSDWA